MVYKEDGSIHKEEKMKLYILVFFLLVICVYERTVKSVEVTVEEVTDKIYKAEEIKEISKIHLFEIWFDSVKDAQKSIKQLAKERSYDRYYGPVRTAFLNTYKVNSYCSILKGGINYRSVV